MTERRFTRSPMRLRSTQGPRFQVEVGDQTFEIDRKPDEPEADDGGDAEEDLIRVSNPSPGVSARLHLAGKTIDDEFESQGLSSSSVEGMSKWVERNQSADQITVTFDAQEIFGQELKHLAWLADRENLVIEIRLRDDV